MGVREKDIGQLVNFLLPFTFGLPLFNWQNKTLLGNGQTCAFFSRSQNACNRL